MAVGDRTHHLFAGLVLEDTSGQRRSPARMAMLYLITIFQYIETMPDHMVSDALRDRLDWKYALHLPHNYFRLEQQELCVFRKNYLEDQTAIQNFRALFVRLREITGPFTGRLLDLEACQVIVHVCMFSRLAKVWESFNRAIEAVATRQPGWLLETSLPHWYERFSPSRRTLDPRLTPPEQAALAQAIGADGFYLLDAVSSSGKPDLADSAEILALRQVWREQYESMQGKLIWRNEACAGCPSSGILPHLLENSTPGNKEVEL